MEKQISGTTDSMGNRSCIVQILHCPDPATIDPIVDTNIERSRVTTNTMELIVRIYQDANST